MSANGPTSHGARTLTAAGLVAVVGALVLGILGMHGLHQHGATTPGSQPVASVSADPHAHHPAPDHTPIATDTAGISSAPVVGSLSDDRESAGDMVMLCVAMLLAAAVGVLLGLRLRLIAHRAPLSLMPVVRVPTFPATARAGTGPPAAWKFSVVRC